MEEYPKSNCVQNWNENNNDIDNKPCLLSSYHSSFEDRLLSIVKL